MRLFKVKKILFVFLVFVNTILCADTTREVTVLTCPEEISIGFLEKEFTWHSTNISGKYLSDPICLNDEFVEITRECRDGQWYPYYVPFCFEFICPEHSTLTENYCLYITEPRTFDDGCPSFNGKFHENDVTDFIWRKKSNDICIVQRETHLNYVSCDDLYSHQCRYWMKDLQEFYAKPGSSTVDISLYFHEYNREMYLTIYTPEGISSFEDDIKCFTHRYDFQDKKSHKHIDFEEIYDFRNVSDRDNYNYRNFTIFELDLKSKPLEYWCSILLRESGTLLTTEKKVGYKDAVGNEFVMYVQVTLKQKYPNDHFEHITNICKKLKVTCRSFELLDFNVHNYTSYFLLHITTKYRKSVTEEYYFIKSTFKDQKGVNIINMLSSDWCLPICDKGVCWESTEIDSVTMSYQLCITKYNMIALRKCGGSFLYGSQWDDFKGECVEDATLSEKTKFLFSLIHTEITTDAIRNLSLIADDPFNLSTMDISFLSNTLYRYSQSNYSTEIASDFYLTFNNLFKIDNKILRKSQTLLNSTDMILNAFDVFLAKHAVHDIDYTNNLYTVVKSNFIIHITKPFLNNVSGLAIYGNSGTFLNCTVTNLYKNQSITDLELNNLEAATFVSEKLLNSLVSNSTEDVKANLTIITTIFYNDSMFNQAANNICADGRIVSVIIPGYGSFLPYPVPILLKRYDSNLTESCGYWAYGNQMQDKRGKWSSIGLNYEEELSNNSSVIYCAFSHLTHFALLVTNEGRSSFDNSSAVNSNDSLLNTVTIVCSIVSLVGITGIFLTAIIYRQWREKLGTKFLLQLSIAIILEIILIQVAGQDYRHVSSVVCTIIGVFLHYVVLAKLSWMLVIAFLQYLRFVKVLGGIPTKLLLKSMLIGWLLPVFPVILTVSIWPSSYTAGHNFCYPTDLALYLCLITPCILIIAANISVFLLIMRAIYTSKAMQYDKSGKLLRRQVHLAVLLFFLLGIHWIFAILAEIVINTWLAVAFKFLFCLTTGLQGFVLFSFYVVLDKDTRLLWKNSIKYRK